MTLLACEIRHHQARLPGLFGPDLRKNVLFDLLHDNLLEKIQPRSTFQWFDVELTWEDGSRETVPWDGRGTWTRIERVGPKRLRSAVIDPRNRIALEVSRVNNGKRLSPDPRLAVSWTARWMFWLQNLLAGGGL